MKRPLTTLLSVATLLVFAAMASDAQAQSGQVSPYINPAPSPGGNYFLGVYTQEVQIEMPSNQGPVGTPTVAMNQPQYLVSPAIAPPGYGPAPQIVRALRVTGVVPNSAAARAGLEFGDIIVRANGQSVGTKSALSRVLRSSGGNLQLLVKCVRTRQFQPLSVYLGGNGAPIF